MSEQQFAPPNPPDAPQRPGICGLFDTIQQETKLLERAVAGYNSMYGVYSQLVGGVPKGQRKRGLPTLFWKATANGKDAVDVCADLKMLPPDQLQYVLVPLIQSQADAILECNQRIAKANTAMYELIVSTTQQPEPQATQQAEQTSQPVVEAFEDEDDSEETFELPTQPQAPPPPAQGPTAVTRRPQRRITG